MDVPLAIPHTKLIPQTVLYEIAILETIYLNQATLYQLRVYEHSVLLLLALWQSS
jgi:hypothetical protein